jgi:hypothetical protein
MSLGMVCAENAEASEVKERESRFSMMSELRKESGSRSASTQRLQPIHNRMSQWDGLRNEYLQLKQSLQGKLDDEIPSLRGGESPLISSLSSHPPC